MRENTAKPVNSNRQFKSARSHFLEYFPRGFSDPDYLAFERNYKWNAHLDFESCLGKEIFFQLIKKKQFEEIARLAIKIESRTNLIFSFEKMALRDALRQTSDARDFALGLYSVLYGEGLLSERFPQWCDCIARLPKKQTRVLTWPIATVFLFLAQPKRHFFLKPTVTKKGFTKCGLTFEYKAQPNWETYQSLIKATQSVRHDLNDLRPRDMIDLQSFIWVQGSEEYS